MKYRRKKQPGRTQGSIGDDMRRANAIKLSDASSAVRACEALTAATSADAGFLVAGGSTQNLPIAGNDYGRDPANSDKVTYRHVGVGRTGNTPPASLHRCPALHVECVR